MYIFRLYYVVKPWEAFTSLEDLKQKIKEKGLQNISHAKKYDNRRWTLIDLSTL